MAALAEAEAWLRLIHAEMKGRPHDQLFQYFRGATRREDLTVHVLNLANETIKAVFPDAAPHGAQASDSWRAERLYNAQCCQYLYYRVLLHLLTTLYPAPDPSAAAAAAAAAAAGAAGAAAGGRARASSSAAAVDPRAREALMSEDLHVALLNCVLEVVVHVSSGQDPSRAFPWATQQAGRGRSTLSLWDAIRWFRGCFHAGSSAPAPAIVRDYLEAIACRVEEELALQPGSNAYDIVVTGGGMMYAAGNKTLVLDFLASFAVRLMRGTAALSGQLLRKACAEAGLEPEDYPEFVQQACQVVDECLMRSLDLFFHKHSAVVIACGIYAAAKVSKLPLSFKTIMAHMVQQAPPGSSISEATFKAVELGVPGLEGDVRQFYNQLFMPHMEGFVRGALMRRPRAEQQGAGAAAAQALSPATQPAVGAAGVAPDSAGMRRGAAPAALPAGPPAQRSPVLKPMPAAALAIQAAVAMDVDQQGAAGHPAQPAATLTPGGSLAAMAAAAGSAAAAAARSASPARAAPACAGQAPGSAPAAMAGDLHRSGAGAAARPAAPLQVRPDSPEAGAVAATLLRTPNPQAPSASSADKENRVQPLASRATSGAAFVAAKLSGAIGSRGSGGGRAAAKAAPAARSAGFQPSRFMVPSASAGKQQQQQQQQQCSQQLGSPAAGGGHMEAAAAGITQDEQAAHSPLAGGAAGSASPAPLPFALQSIAEERQQQARRPLAGLSPAQANTFRSLR